MQTTSHSVAVVHAGKGGLTRRGRAYAFLLAVMLLVAGIMFATIAGATPFTDPGGNAGIQNTVGVHTTGGAQDGFAESGWTGAGPQAVDADGYIVAAAAENAIRSDWSGYTVQVDWRGNPFVTSYENFIGERTLVPGDRVRRTLYLQNAGPADAVLTVILGLARDLDYSALNIDLAQDVELFWTIGSAEGVESFRSLHGLDTNQIPVPGRTENEATIAQVSVAQGATVPVTVGVSFADTIEYHYMAGEVSKLLEFTVLAHMAGELPTTPDGPSVTPTPDLPVTGAAILGVLSLAGALGIFGWLLLAGARRRRCEVCDTPLPRRNRADVCEGAPFTCEMALAIATATA